MPAVICLDVFYQARRLRRIRLGNHGIVTSEAWGSPDIPATYFPVDLTGQGIASAEAWGSPYVEVPIWLDGCGIASVETWGTPDLAVVAGVDLTGQGIASAEAWGSPDIFLPLDLAPDAWYRSDLGITLSDDEVVTWADQSNSNDISRPAPGAGPTYDTGGTWPLLVFASAHTLRQAGIVTASQVYTWWMVLQVTDNTGVRCYGHNGTDGFVDGFAVVASGGTKWLHNATTVSIFTAHGAGLERWIAAHAGTPATPGDWWVNGVYEAGSNADAAPVPVVNFAIGADYGAGYASAAKIAEVGLVGRLLTVPERNRLVHYMEARYG